MPPLMYIQEITVSVFQSTKKSTRLSAARAGAIMSANIVRRFLPHPFDKRRDVRVVAQSRGIGEFARQGSLIEQAVKLFVTDPVQPGPIAPAFPAGHPVMPVDRGAFPHWPATDRAGS